MQVSSSSSSSSPSSVGGGGSALSHSCWTGEVIRRVYC